MASSSRRAPFMLEDVEELFSNESDADDDWDELFTPSDLEEDEDEDANDLDQSNPADGGDDESGPEGDHSAASSCGKSSSLTSPSSPAERTPRRQRCVNGIDQALDAANFAEMELLPPIRKSYVGYLGPRKKKSTEKINWTDRSPNPQGRQRRCDIIRVAPGLKSQEAKSVENTGEAFDLFFSEEMMDLLLSSTNLKIKQTLAEEPPEALTDGTKPYLRTTDKCVLYAVIGLFYYRKLMGLNNHSVQGGEEQVEEAEVNVQQVWASHLQPTPHADLRRLCVNDFLSIDCGWQSAETYQTCFSRTSSLCFTRLCPYQYPSDSH